MLLFRPPLQHFGLAGVRPANFAALGTDPSPLANDLPALGDRANAEWLWVLLSPLPSSGTTEVDDRGGYALVSPADGVYTQDYRGMVMPSTGAPQVYTATITTTVGAGAASYVGVPASMSAAATLSAAAGTYTAAGGGAAYITTAPYRDRVTRSLLPGITIPHVMVINPATASVVLTLANQTTAGDATLSVSDATLVAATRYIVASFNNDGSALGLEACDAA